MNEYDLPKMILASASPARKKVLQNAGLDPQIIVSNFDEDALITQYKNASPAQLVTALAQGKAGEVAASLEPSPQVRYIVGCDSMMELNGKILGKPHTVDIALQRVRELSGASGQLHTGHWVIKLEAEEKFLGLEHKKQLGQCASSTIFFSDFSQAEAQAYVNSKEPLEVAGSFTLDGIGGAFIEKIVGDPHNIVGISLPLLRKLTVCLGAFWPDFWRLKDD